MSNEPLDITFPTREIAERGETIYAQKYQAQYEKTLRGKYVAINVNNGEAVVADTAGDALRTGLEKDPNGLFHLVRVGHRAPFEAGWYLSCVG
ncbi:MAG TPA: hypothetical protein VG759_09050 [Candidatus Angelobacter sp.]|jgi:hypothetical protein|nr:hypothetical protein [Candidatus Angelobacter sp.]